MSRLVVENVSVHYGAQLALDAPGLALGGGRLIGLIGPNGAGKSTLLKAIVGLVPSTGSVSWAGRSLALLDPRARARTLAYLPQAATAHWPLSARAVVALGRLPHRAFANRPSAADEAAVDWAIAQTETEPLADRPVDRLSGGERARVLLARALAVRAPVLLVDEPVASLDPYHQLQIMTVLRRYAAGPSLVVVVLHNLSLAARFCERVVLIDRGRIVGDGAPAQVLAHEMLRRHYRIEPYLGEYEHEPVVLPWRRLD